MVIFLTSGRKSKPEVGLPHTISVLFWHEILPDDEENDLESNELCINIGETGNTGEICDSFRLYDQLFVILALF